MDQTLDQLIQNLFDAIFEFLAGVFAWLSDLFTGFRPGGNAAPE